MRLHAIRVFRCRAAQLHARLTQISARRPARVELDSQIADFFGFAKVSRRLVAVPAHHYSGARRNRAAGSAGARSLRTPNPTPSITSLSPSSVTAGAAPFRLTVPQLQ
jgi:hypothetical protein